MSQQRILIVGASIAGPAAAYWFAKAGAQVTVIERFPELRTRGHNIDIRNWGVLVMRKISGMEEAVRAKRAALDGMSLIGEDGYVFGTLVATGDPEQQSLVSEYEILRGDLSRIFYDMTKDSERVQYVFGEQLTSIQQGEKEDGPVTVEYMNGRPSEEFDLVVACDGAQSRTRAIGLGCGVRDHVVPTGAAIAYCGISQDFLDGSNVGIAFNGSGGRSVGFGAFGADGEGANRVIFMNRFPTEEAIAPLRKALKEGEQATKEFLAKHYAGMGWKTQEAIDGMMKSDDFYMSEIVKVRCPTLSRGRFAMVGDAGYAPGQTGLGTSLAIYGAYVLAGEMCKADGNIKAALQGYEDIMSPIVSNPDPTGDIFLKIFLPQTNWGIWLRNHIFQFIMWSGMMRFAGGLGSLMGKVSPGKSLEERFPIPEYEWKY